MTLILPSRISSVAAWPRTNPMRAVRSGKVLASAGPVLHAQSDTNEAICCKSYPSITASKASRAAVRIFMFRLAEKHNPCQHAVENCKGPVS